MTFRYETLNMNINFLLLNKMNSLRVFIETFCQKNYSTKFFTENRLIN
jgi:hypothetical protein